MKNIFTKKMLIIASFALIAVFAFDLDQAEAKKKLSDVTKWSKSGCGNFNIGDKHYGGSQTCSVLGINCGSNLPPPPPPPPPPQSTPTTSSGSGGRAALNVTCAPEKSYYEIGQTVKWIGYSNDDVNPKFSWTGDFTTVVGKALSKIYNAENEYSVTFNGTRGTEKSSYSCKVNVCKYLGNNVCNPCPPDEVPCQGVCIGNGFECRSGVILDVRDVEIKSFVSSPVIVPKGSTCDLEWSYIGTPDICTLTGTDGSSKIFQGADLKSPGSHKSQSIFASTDFTLYCKNDEFDKEDTAKASCIVNPALIEN